MNRVLRFLVTLAFAITPMLSASAQSASETEGMQLAQVDSSMSTSYVMQHRPFVLPDHLTPAFDFDSVSTSPISETDARVALRRFLTLRNLADDRIAAIVARFDDPIIGSVIPAPNLRAALLMLSDWNPYQATIDAILDGKNESGHPFEAVDFRSLEFGSAVATLQVAYSTGAPRLLVSDRYEHEIPEQLIPVLVHESMHDGVDNSFEEEIIASLLDSLTYAEVLSVDPDAANTGTELAAYNNVQLFAMMNSIGRRGAGFVGVETSLDGDVYIGIGLEQFDADSIRAGIASDPWYAQLPTGGSQGGAVLAALLSRFPDSAALVASDRFSPEAISAIDNDIGLILTPRKVRALAIELGLSLTTEAFETVDSGGRSPTVGLLDARPFLPTNTELFDLRSMHPAPTQLDAEFSRAALRESVIRAGNPTAEVNAAVAQFDDPALVLLAPDPTLRAGLLMLERDERWFSILASAVGGANEAGAPVHLEFAELPNAVPAVWDSDGWGGTPVVWVNDMLQGERPELLATAIAEGLLLESSAECSAQSIMAAALSTVLWADLISDDPSLTESATWGTISRNRDLLALLNSQPFDPGNPTASDIGLRLSTGTQGDVLPGLLRDAGSFADYVLSSPRVTAASHPQGGDAPPVLTALLQRAGIEQSASTSNLQIDDALLAHVDIAFANILPASEIVDVATILGLTLSTANS